MDDGANSEDEDCFASKGYPSLYKLTKTQSICRDDNDVVECKSPFKTKNRSPAQKIAFSLQSAMGANDDGPCESIICSAQRKPSFDVANVDETETVADSFTD